MVRGSDAYVEEVKRLVAVGKAAWPGFEIDDDYLRNKIEEQLVERRLVEGRASEPAPAELHASDLFLAAACARGHPEALAAFDESFLSHVAAYVARLNPSAEFADEVRQRLREKLLVGDAQSP